MVSKFENRLNSHKKELWRKGKRSKVSEHMNKILRKTIHVIPGTSATYKRQLQAN